MSLIPAVNCIVSRQRSKTNFTFARRALGAGTAWVRVHLKLVVGSALRREEGSGSQGRIHPPFILHAVTTNPRRLSANTTSIPPLGAARGLFHCRILCNMGLFFVSSSALLLTRNKNCGSSDTGSVPERLLTSQVLSPSLRLSFLCALPLPFVTWCTLNWGHLAPHCFACRVPKPLTASLLPFWQQFHGNTPACGFPGCLE